MIELNVGDLQRELSNRIDNAVISMDKNPLGEQFLNEVLGSIESLGYDIILQKVAPSATALDGLANTIAGHVSVSEEVDNKVVLSSDVEISQIIFELEHAGWKIYPPMI